MLPHVLPAVYLTIRHLHPLCQPAHVVRHDGKTLVMLDPRSLRAELVFWALDNLTDAERIAMRTAYDLDPDPTRPISDEVLDGDLGDEPIPTALRLPTLVPTRAAQRSA